MTANEKLRSEAYDFIVRRRLGALATVSEGGEAHVAPVYCIVDKDLCVYFSTRVEGRKFMNLMRHPMVSMTFVNEPEVATIQLTGTAERVESIDKEAEVMFELARHRFLDPLPAMEQFFAGYTNQLAVIKVTPTEMTLAKYGTPETGKYRAFFQKVI